MIWFRPDKVCPVCQRRYLGPWHSAGRFGYECYECGYSTDETPDEKNPPRGGDGSIAKDRSS